MTWDCFEHKMLHHCIKMEFQKIINLLGTTSDDKDLPRFITKKWIEIYEQSEKKYNPNKEIRIKTSMLRSDLCDFSDAYIIVKRDITLGDNNANKRNQIAEQQSVTLLLTMQILLILQCLCTI